MGEPCLNRGFSSRRLRKWWGLWNETIFLRGAYQSWNRFMLRCYCNIFQNFDFRNLGSSSQHNSIGCFPLVLLRSDSFNIGEYPLLRDMQKIGRLLESSMIVWCTSTYVDASYLWWRFCLWVTCDVVPQMRVLISIFFFSPTVDTHSGFVSCFQGSAMSSPWQGDERREK